MESSLAVIGTFYEKRENSLPILMRLLESTRQPDEVWLLCETDQDADALVDAYDVLFELELVELWPKNMEVIVLPTPREEDGSYSVIPYSNKINYALDETECDLICYLDNGSMPEARKYALMASALQNNNPHWGAVYCTQKRTGHQPMTFEARDPVGDPFCVLNYTQIMHRKTDDRWTLDMKHANPDLADGMFMQALSRSLGTFWPVYGEVILDDHHIPYTSAAGV